MTKQTKKVVDDIDALPTETLLGELELATEVDDTISELEPVDPKPIEEDIPNGTDLITMDLAKVVDDQDVEVKPLIVSGLFHEINFPTDIYGVTSELKAAFRALGSRIAGNKEKYALVKHTLQYLVAFIDTKYERDNTLPKTKTVLTHGDAGDEIIE